MKPETLAVNLLKQSLKNMAVDRIMKELVLSAKFFAFPGIHGLTAGIIALILDYAIEKTELGLYFVYTDYITDLQAKGFLDSLKKHQENPTDGTEQELINKFNDFISIAPKQLRP